MGALNVGVNGNGRSGIGLMLKQHLTGKGILYLMLSRRGGVSSSRLQENRRLMHANWYTTLVSTRSYNH